MNTLKAKCADMKVFYCEEVSVIDRQLFNKSYHRLKQNMGNKGLEVYM